MVFAVCLQSTPPRSRIYVVEVPEEILFGWFNTCPGPDDRAASSQERTMAMLFEGDPNAAVEKLVFAVENSTAPAGRLYVTTDDGGLWVWPDPGAPAVAASSVAGIPTSADFVRVKTTSRWSDLKVDAAALTLWTAQDADSVGQDQRAHTHVLGIARGTDGINGADLTKLAKTMTPPLPWCQLTPHTGVDLAGITALTAHVTIGARPVRVAGKDCGVVVEQGIANSPPGTAAGTSPRVRYRGDTSLVVCTRSS